MVFLTKNVADDYIKSYLDKAKTTSYKLETAHNFFLHAVIGACLTKPHAPFQPWIPSKDYRTHVLLIRPSGSGKAPVYDMAEKLASQVNLTFATRTIMTEAGLIGTHDKKLGIQYGDAMSHDILGYTEASNLFTTRSHSKTMMTSLNTLLDEKREVHKSLAWGIIDYNTNVSLMLTTFPSPLVYDQLQSGFMQRCFVLYEVIGLDVYKEISQYLNEIVWTKRPIVILTDLVKRLEEIKQKDFKFRTRKKVRKAMNDVVDDFGDIVTGFQDVQKDVLKTFMTRQTRLLHKLMCHHASLELRENLTLEDVEYAKLLCFASYKSICRYIKDNYKRDSRYERVERLIERLKAKGKKRVKLHRFTAGLRPMKVSEVKDILMFEKDLVTVKDNDIIIK